MLLLVGVLGGVAGVMVVQQRLLPPRLSAPEAAALRERLAQAEQDRDRARGDLDATTQRLDSVVAERKTLADELAADRERTKNARANEEFLIASLPPDPRGGAVEVRAARLTATRRACLRSAADACQGRRANARGDAVRRQRHFRGC